MPKLVSIGHIGHNIEWVTGYLYTNCELMTSWPDVSSIFIRCCVVESDRRRICIWHRAEPGLGIGIGIGRFFTKSEKIRKSGFLLPVFPLKIFFGTLFV